MRSTLRTGTTALTTAIAIFLASTPVAAHVRYTAPSNGSVSPAELFVNVVTDPFNAALLGGGALAVGIAALAYLRFLPFRRDISVFREAVAEYRDLLPWLLRLSFGLPLVGAGFAGYFVSPAVEPAGSVLPAAARLFQIGLGFALLFGLGTRVVAAIGLATYAVATVFEPQLLLAFEYVPGFVAIVLLGSGRPSADEVLEVVASAEGTVYGRIDPVHRLTGSVRARVGPYQRFVPTVIRVGIGLNFAYLGLIEKLLTPGQALAVVDKYDLTAVVPVDPGLWVVGAGLVEIALGIVLIVGAFTRAGSLVALLMFTLTLFALPDDPVLAHISLFGLASTLLVTGAGPYSLDRWIGERFTTPSAGRDGRIPKEDADLAGD
ncbi:doxx protein [Salinarchaeum sp. Harcht-Bsk1]|uniref:DoxX family protein n=1 Tax=Salinarchaeum sp. Harcht-Bsk1 TaxID=1333523 RepID=UPI0003422949|nr:DoxX family protein [Salinarchaeum sp. Harcht-Bsk1]AGN02830.1 doxx protein [Salinarchaeum sp. Harcht-Bsk1]